MMTEAILALYTSLALLPVVTYISYRFGYGTGYTERGKELQEKQEDLLPCPKKADSDFVVYRYNATQPLVDRRWVYAHKEHTDPIIDLEKQRGNRGRLFKNGKMLMEWG